MPGQTSSSSTGGLPSSAASLARRLLWRRLALPCGALVLLLGLLFVRVERDRLMQRDHLLGAAIVSFVADFMRDNLHTLTTLARELPAGEGERLPIALVLASPHFIRLHWLDAHGRPTSPALPPPPPDLFPASESVREDVAVSRPVIDPETGETLIFLRATLPQGGLLLGETRLHDLQEVLSHFSLLHPYASFLVTDADGTIMAATDLALVRRQQSLAVWPPFLALTDGGGSVVHHAGRWQLVSTTALPVGGWKLFIATPLWDVLGPAVRSVLALEAALLAFFTALGLGLRNGLHRVLLDPLMAWATSLPQRAQGVRVDESRQGSFAEMERLRQAFDDVLASIHDSQQSLRESEAAYRALFFNALDGIFRATPEGRFLDVNPAMAAMLGHASPAALLEEAPSLPRLHVLPDQYQSLLERLVRDGEARDVEAALQRRDGARIRVVMTVRGVKDQEGFLVRLEGICSEVTERRRQEQALQSLVQETADVAGEAFFRNLVRWLRATFQAEMAMVCEALPGGMTRPLVMRVEDVTMERPRGRASLAMQGAVLERVAEEGFLHHPEGAASRFPADSLLAEFHIQGHLGLALRDSQGLTRGFLRLLSSQALPLPPWGESLLRLVGARAAAELERHAAMEALRDSESRFRSIVENAPLGMHLFDLAATETGEDLHFAGANPAAARILGMDLAPLAGRPILEVFPGLANTDLPARYRAVAKTGEPWSTASFLYEDEALAGNFDVWAFQPSPGRVAVFFMDVGEKMRAARELVQAKEAAEAASVAKSRFLANMSHELRTPLNGLVGMLQLLTFSPLDAEQRQYVEAALQSGRRLTRLLSDILDLSRVEAGRLALMAEPFSLAEALGEIQETYAPLALEKDITLTCRQDPSLPRLLLGDETRLRQILHNLVGNAMKFTSHGEVRLEATRLSRRADGRLMALFVVSDTGRGMAEAALDQIFQPFTQLAPTRTRQFQGAGLGLSIVKRLLELLDGHMTVTSEEGRGTTFEVAIPFALPDGA